MAAEGMIIDFGASDNIDDSSPFSSPIKGNYVDFFWGTGCRGFEVLLNNLKVHVTASHQIGEYLKDRVLLEKSYVKSLRKLSKTLNSAPESNFGGLYPVWLVLLRTIDQVCINKDRQVNALHELGKSILEYSSKRDDHMKSDTKGDIDSAQKSLTNYRTSLISVKKSHKAYEHSCREVAQHEIEVERLKNDPLKEQELKKADHKIKKLKSHMEHMKSEYQREVDGCNDRLTDYEDKMTKACQKFQSLEEDYLKVMREYMSKLAEINQTCDISVYKEYKKLSEKLDAFPVEKLISMFSQIKGTGKVKPEPIKFTPIQEDAIKLSRKGSLGADDVVTVTTTDDTSKQKGARKGLFKKEKKKKKEGKVKSSKERSSSNADNSRTATPTNNDKEESYEVDEEGYRIRPKDADKIAKFSDDESSNDDDSDFDDSESDNEPEKRIKNIKIKVKNDASSDTISVDELSVAAKTLKLDPLPSVSGLKTSVKRSGSSQSLNTTSFGTPQLNRANISADTRSLHDPLDNAINDPPRDSPSPIMSLPPPVTSVDIDVTIPPLMPLSETSSTATPVPADLSSLSSLPPWDISSSLPPPSSTPSQNWATFSSDFSGSGFPTPELQRVDQPNKSIDLGTLGGGDTGKAESSSLNKSVPAMAPTISSLPNPTGSLLLPPPSKPVSSSRRRGMTTTTDTTVSSLDIPSMSRLPSTSSLGSTTGPPLSPLMNAQKIRQESSSPNLNANKVATPTNGSLNKSSGVIPFAIAFQEHCHAIYKGTDQSKAIVKVTGHMDFSFPASCIPLLESCEPLKFRLLNVSMVNKVLHNENILKREDEHTYIFIMDKLHGQLKELEKKGSPFCNVQGLRYEVNCTESSFPFRVSVAWKCDQTTTAFKLDYSYNPSVFPSASKPTLTNGTVKVTIDGGVTQHSLEPLGVWQVDKKLAGWKLGPLFPEKDPTTGSLEGKFNITSGPTPATPAIIHFVCDGSTLSGISMASLATGNYKVSLVKNKCLAGKFIAEPN